jgi:hypothetical protein
MSREPTIKATSRTRVEIGLRRFIVEFNGDKAIRIKERKADSPKGRVRDVAYWSAKHHPVGGPDSMSARILAAARLLHAPEADRAATRETVAHVIANARDAGLNTAELRELEGVIDILAAAREKSA